MKKTKTETTNRPFDIHLPSRGDDTPERVETIQVEVYLDADGDEILTPESIARIDEVHARHRGLLTGSDIREMRERLGMTQKELAHYLGCGAKTLSRWENGSGYPSELANRILRLLDEGFVSPASLESVMGPRGANPAYVPTMPAAHWKVEKPPVRQVGEMRISKKRLFRAPLDDYCFEIGDGSVLYWLADDELSKHFS